MSSPARPGRERSGAPVPFTSEWISSPPLPPRPRRFEFNPRWMHASTPAWLPSDRTLSALLVLLLVCVAAFATSGGSDPSRLAASDVRPNASGEANGDAGGTMPAVGGDTSEPDETQNGVVDDARDEQPTEPAPTEIVTATVNLDQPQTFASADGSLLPQYRILTYYGHPHDANMGILGQFGVENDLDGLRQRLEEQAEEYRKADPSRPIKLAFEVIASVAQGAEQDDGSWLMNTDAPTIQEYIDYAAAHDMLVFLDVQIGRRGVPEEIELVRQFLEQPNVHLALDPEFAIGEGEVPGDHIGSITADDVRYAQDYLVELTTSLGIPPKVLVVHQFLLGMIQNKENIEPVPGVQLVIVMDGHGPPNTKIETYGAVISSQPVEYNGFKLFYDQDTPLLTAREILGLEPVPDLIIYQ
jgi:hypothetical protein